MLEACEYSFEISVSGDHLKGNGEMRLFDARGQPIEVIATTFAGQRVTLQG
jgi:hypothetical protein